MLDLLHTMDAVEDYILIPFEQGSVLFNESLQSIFILNHSASIIWCAAFEVEFLSELMSYLQQNYAIGEAQAELDIRQFCSNFNNRQLLLPSHKINEIQYNSYIQAIKPSLHHTFINEKIQLQLEISEHVFVFILADALLLKEMKETYADFISELSPYDEEQMKMKGKTKKMSIEVVGQSQYFEIYRDQQCVAQNMTLNGLFPYLFGLIFETLWQAVIKTSDLMFHACVMSKNNKTLLFPAESGSGKSTLSAVLMAHDWVFLSDELAIISMEKQIIKPSPLPICVKDSAREFLAKYYPQILTLAQYQRLDAKKVQYLAVDKPKSYLDNPELAPIKAIIFPRYDAKVICQFETMDKAQALKLLLMCGSSGRSLNSHECKQVIQLIEQLPCYSLLYSDIDLALEKINAL